MKQISIIFLILIIISGVCSSCITNDDENNNYYPPGQPRPDGAVKIGFSDLPGSCQNGAWSEPSINKIVFTNFRTGYNKGDAYLYVCNVSDYSIELLIDGYNVTMPGGACVWNPVINKILFSHINEDTYENVYMINPDGTELQRITNEVEYMAWEPGFSPEGTWIVYERVDEANTGHTIYKCEAADYSKRVPIDESGDCRQPSWSPRGDYICYQKYVNGKYEIIVCNTDGTDKRRLLQTEAESTDCSFSPDGAWIVFSSEYNCIHANIYICTSEGSLHPPSEWVRITNDPGYDDAPAWSQDGHRILFEHTDGNPDSSGGAGLWIIEAPEPGWL